MMQRLLIVDDDASTRNGLMRHIPWKNHGIGMIQTAGSGQEALSICEQFQPDIVLSDIRMRGMNGIEMCTELHKKFPDCQMIFISGYSDKEYLKGAISLGAVSYVEKPVDPLELESALGEAAVRARAVQTRRTADEMLTRNAAYIKREAFLSLLKGTERSQELERNVASSGLLSGSYDSFRVFIVRTEAPVVNIRLFQDELGALLQKAGVDTNACFLHGEFADNRHLLLLLSYPGHMFPAGRGLVEAFTQIASQRIEGIRVFLSVGKQVTDKFQLEASYKSACEFEKSVFFRGYGQACCTGRKKEFIHFDEALYDKFAGALAAGNEKLLEKLLGQVRDLLRDGEAVMDSFVRNIYFSLLHRIFQQYHRLFPGRQSELDARWKTEVAAFESFDTLEEVHRFMLRQVHALTEENCREANNASVIVQITRYIQQNYPCRELSIKSLADQVYLTPTYLSYLFKQKTGVTIGKYLTDTRMEHAKELLRDKKFKLYHVAEQVGYDDPNYFAKIFKKQVGVTPSEYRDWGG